MHVLWVLSTKRPPRGLERYERPSGGDFLSRVADGAPFAFLEQKKGLSSSADYEADPFLRSVTYSITNRMKDIRQGAERAGRTGAEVAAGGRPTWRTKPGGAAKFVASNRRRFEKALKLRYPTGKKSTTNGGPEDPTTTTRLRKKKRRP